MNKVKVLGIIPARLASTRLPGKPLLDIGGVSMIERVYRQAEQASCFSTILVATDHPSIMDKVTSFGGTAMMTSSQHPNGTSRCAEVVGQLNENYGLIINIQGDEPFIHPGLLDELAEWMLEKNAEIGTLCREESDMSLVRKSSVVKVVLDQQQKALYFSRSVVPFYRDGQPESSRYLTHLGLYAFRSDILPRLAALPASPLEEAEQLEQLRWLGNGYSIHVMKTNHNSFSIDTPEDLQRAKDFIHNQ